MTARIKAKIVAKEVKNHTCGIPTRIAKTMNVTATGLEMYNRVVVFNLGEMAELIAAAKLAAHARQLMGNSSWGNGAALIAKLEDAVKLQPGLEVEVPQ